MAVQDKSDTGSVSPSRFAVAGQSAPSARSIRKGLADGKLTPRGVVDDWFGRIDAADPVIKAWAHIDRDQVEAAADRLPKPRKADRLYGIPIGVKDIIDTATQPTAYGSPIYSGHQPAADAYVVARSRSLGALIMGKTATAEFAWTHPPSTTNPWNPSHTPGGSSSGSAAAVAAGMAPLALGTQTSGSVIRPALFCGVAGMKPTAGLINRTGVKPFSDSFDTVGAFARDVADIAFFLDALWRRQTVLPESGSGMSVGVLFPESAHMADQPALMAVEIAAAALAADGMTVRRMTVPSWLEEVFTLQRTVSAYEGARALAFERFAFPDMLSDGLKMTIDKGAATDMDAWLAAIRRLDLLRPLADGWISEVDAIITIGANGEAPEGLSTTGDSRFCRPWTALHTPCVAVPVGLGPCGLPIGVQIVAPRWADGQALAVAHRLDCATQARRMVST